MLAHHTTLALRRLWRHRQVNVIRIISLSLGLAGSLVLFLVVNYMFSFDRHHLHMERSYWVVTDIKGESVMQTDAAPRPLAEVLRSNYPFVESATCLETVFGRTISVSDSKQRVVKKFNEARNICFAEPQYFNHFLISWVSGTPKTALAMPNTIVISERYAQKYFGSIDPIGRTLRFDNSVNLTVTGVIKNPPANTQLRYDALISYATIPGLEQNNRMQDWEGLQSMCFVLLRSGTKPQQLERALQEVRRKNLPAAKADQYNYHVLPLEDLNHERSGMAPRPILYALIAVGLLLILAACINYINLATAQALQRSKEVGVRKVVGGNQMQLIMQFLFETAILTAISVVIALILTQLAMPLVNRTLAAQVDMLQPVMSIQDLLQPRSFGWFFLLIICVILLAGLYPAWVISNFATTRAIKGQITMRTVGGLSVRRALITGQFILAQLFLIVVLIISAQLRHMQEVDWSFNHKYILAVRLAPSHPVPYERLRQSWVQLPGVECVTYGSDPPASPYNRPTPFSYHLSTKPESFDTRLRAADPNYLATFGLSLVAGRNFRATDTTAQEVIVNEMLVRQLGISPVSEVVGKRMRVKDKERLIVGVVKDFRSGDLHQGLVPLTLVHDLEHTTMALLTLTPTTPKSTLQAVQQVWNETSPEHVYRADYLDDLLNSFLGIERLLAGFVQIFAFTAIAMSCLGLYGLVTFMAEGRAKEIGVRRVLGARTPHLLWIFGKEFGRLILFGFLIAAPIGWWISGNWLQQYTHRIALSGWFFAASLGLTVLITAFTVLWDALKAVTANPVKYLKVH